MPPKVHRIDHLVLTVRDIDITIAFYETVLGMKGRPFEAADGTARWSLAFGSQKINLHKAGAEFEPKASRPMPGTADLCFLSDTPVKDWQTHLMVQQVKIEDGPIRRTGARGPLMSIYFRDPDGNLIEVSNTI